MAKKTEKKPVKRNSRKAVQSSPGDRLASESQLIHLRLTEAHAQQADLPEGGPLPTNLRANARIVTSANEARNRYRVEVVFELLMSFDAAPKNAAIVIGAKFQLTLACEDAKLVTDNAIAEFGQNGAMFILWPYWRQHVNATLASMGLPSYTLPLYKSGFFAQMEELPVEQEA